MFSKIVLKIVPMHVYRFYFFNTSNTYRVFGNYFDRAENRSSTLVWETRGDCCLKSLKRKADYFILTTSSEKNFRLIASRKEKIHEIL